MFEEEKDGERFDQADSEESVLLQCPNCQKSFSQRRSLLRHINNSCKKHPPDPGPHASGPRLPPRALVKAAELHCDEELNSLLAAIDSDYVRWRLAQKLGIAQQSSYPILFNCRFPGSKTSSLSLICPTSDPSTVMYNVLTDAKKNFQVDKITMPKNVTIIDPDGSHIEVSKWLKPVNNRGGNRLHRPDRHIIDVEESDDSLVYSLVSGGGNTVDDTGDDVLEESLKMMSLDDNNNKVLDCKLSVSYLPRFKCKAFKTLTVIVD